MIHRIIAIILGLFFILALTGKLEYYSEINKLLRTRTGYLYTGKYIGGGNVLFLYLIAIISIYFIGFSNHASKKLSPKAGGLWEPMITSGWFIFAGYFFAVLMFFLLELFT